MHRNCPWKSRSASGRLSSKGHARELLRSTKIGCPRCGGRSREKVDRVEGSCTDTSAIPGRFRSPLVAKHGFAIAGSSWQFEGSSWFGQERSQPQAGVPSGGFCAPLRRGDARVDGVATEGFASDGAAGHLVEVARISNLTKVAAEWQEIIQEQGAAVPSAGNSDDEFALRGAPGEGRFAPF